MPSLHPRDCENNVCCLIFAGKKCHFGQPYLASFEDCNKERANQLLVPVEAGGWLEPLAWHLNEGKHLPDICTSYFILSLREGRVCPVFGKCSDLIRIGRG